MRANISKRGVEKRTNAISCFKRTTSGVPIPKIPPSDPMNIFNPVEADVDRGFIRDNADEDEGN